MNLINSHKLIQFEGYYCSNKSIYLSYSSEILSVRLPLPEFAVPVTVVDALIDRRYEACASLE